MRVNITTCDPVHAHIYDKEESAELFGDDYILDYGEELPDELVARYKKAYIEFWAVQDEIDKIRKNRK